MSVTKYIASAFLLAAFGPLTLSGKPPKKIVAPYLETGGERELDVVYKNIGKQQLKFDLYQPTGKSSDKAPVIIYTHGGGWAAGSRSGVTKSLFAPLFKRLLDEGFAVASVDYRLVRPQSKVVMRDCVIDSKDAVRFLAKNADSFGLDHERFYVFGDSAGGQIAQMLLLSPLDSFVGDAALNDISYEILAGVSWYGPCDFQDMNLFNHDDRPDFKDRFGSRILGEAKVSAEEEKRLYSEMSPVDYLKKDSPPLFMIQGDKDTTIPVKHAYRMEKRADEIQAPVKTLIIKNSGHNWRKVDLAIEPSRDEIIEATVGYFVDHEKKLK